MSGSRLKAPNLLYLILLYFSDALVSSIVLKV